MYFLIIFLLTFIFRSIFIFFFPETGGDYDIYSKVAKNILRGCGVSLSDPLLDDCVPHFGGNHGQAHTLDPQREPRRGGRRRRRGLTIVELAAMIGLLSALLLTLSRTLSLGGKPHRDLSCVLHV